MCVSVRLALLSVDEALAALLKTPPPKAGNTPTRKQKPKKKSRKKARGGV
jgi:hypothetical protein